jgi:hypothetical protein
MRRPQLILVSVALVAAFALPLPVAAAAESTIVRQSIPIDVVGGQGCADPAEEFRLTGTFEIVTHLVTFPDGSINATERTRIVDGELVSLATGARYSLIYNVVTITQQAADGSFTVVQVLAAATPTLEVFGFGLRIVVSADLTTEIVMDSSHYACPTTKAF